MEPTRSLPRLQIGMAILTALTLSLCAFPDLTLAEISSSADSHPCQTDVNCELGSYCSASGKCTLCAQCSIYSRLPKPSGNRQCAKSFSECGKCIPGNAYKEESGGMSSRRCFPIAEVFPDLFATSTTSTAGSASENSSSGKQWCIALGGLLVLLIASAACYGVFQLWRRSKPPMDTCAANEVYQQQPPSAPHVDAESPPPYEEGNFNVYGRATEPLFSGPETSRSTIVVHEKERLTQAEVLNPPNYSRVERPADAGEVTDEDDLPEENQHSYGSAVTVYPDEEDRPSGLALNEQIEQIYVEESFPFLSQEQLTVRRSTTQPPVAQSHTSPRSQPRIVSRTVSDGDLHYVSFPSLSLSVTSSRSNFDLSPGIYTGVHVNRNGRWDSLHSVRHTTGEESALPLQSLQGAESGSEDLCFESRSEGREEGSSTGTSHSSLPRNGLSVCRTSADSGIFNENQTVNAMKKDVGRDSDEGSVEDVDEVPAKRPRRDLENEVMSTVIYVPDFEAEMNNNDSRIPSSNASI